MSLTMRMPRSFVVLLGVVYLVSSIGCASGRLGQSTAAARSANVPPAQATSQAMPRRLPHIADESHVQPASFQSGQAAAAHPQTAGGDPLFDVAVASRPCYEGFEADGSVVRAQHDPYNGPVRDFLISPYGIGLMFVAAIVLPIALDPRERPVGGGP
jgi:hypothetical protein